MKKLLYILLLILLPEMVAAREYVGTLYVGESLKMENIRVEVVVAAKSGMVVVKMYGVKFSKWMPVRVDVEIRNVKDVGGVLTLDYGVPMMNGKVYEKRKVRNLSGKYDGKSVSLRMKLGKSDVRFNGKKGIVGLPSAEGIDPVTRAEEYFARVKGNQDHMP